MIKPKRFFDTSSLLLLLDKAFEEDFVISSITLMELEGIKTNQNKSFDIKYKARKLTRLLAENEGKYSTTIAGDWTYKQVEQFNLPINNDNLIMANAWEYGKTYGSVVFYTDDMACKCIAREIFELEVMSVGDKVKEEGYTGYKLMSGSTEYINNYLNNINSSEWSINEYIIIENTDIGKTTEMRYNGENFVPLRLPSSNYIKAKNSLQRCALDLLMNKDITAIAILGGYGSGKSFLSMQMALYNVIEKGNQSKILGVREAKGEGAEIGFLKGTFSEKTNCFFKPLEQQLKGGEFELNTLMARGVLETNIPFYLKGTTYNDTIILVDEAEDLADSQIKLIGTRVGENSKVYFSGDYEQSLIDKTENNGLVKLCNELKGNPMFGCIYLDDDVRSETSKLFAGLFKTKN